MASRAPMLVLDGRTGEGGGQILRTGLFLSTLTGTPFRLEHIRAGRPKPGLKPQHVGILRVLAQVSDCRVEGATAGSTVCTFWPGAIRAGETTYDIGTAGSISLFLQTLLPCSLLAPGRFSLTLVGGTDVPFSPAIEWLEHTMVPLLGRVSPVTLEILERGFIPAGGGRVRVVTEGVSTQLVGRVATALPEERLHPGRKFRCDVHGLAHVGLRERRVAERQAEAAAAILPKDWSTQIHSAYVPTKSPGSVVVLRLEDELGNRWAADGLGAVRVTAEAVGQAAARSLLEDVDAGGTVDRHLADHLVPWIALGMGARRVPAVTPHLETNVWVCQQFLGKDAVRLEGNVLRKSSSRPVH